MLSLSLIEKTPIAWLKRILVFIKTKPIVVKKIILNLLYGKNLLTSDELKANQDECLKIFRVLLQEVTKGGVFNCYIPGRILLINSSLAFGGAERQVVNTMIGLKNRPIESATLVCEYLFKFPDSDSYLPILQNHEISVFALPSYFENLEEALRHIPRKLKVLLTRIPKQFSFEILNLAAEFKARQPEILHAWQDSTSIKCGIAAAIAGVPKIILSSRSVPPFNFHFYEPYMYPGYQALSELPNVHFINNSEAGAYEYCKWLGLPRERFKVLRNGIDLNYLMRQDIKKIADYKKTLNIPQDAYIIGSIYRFDPVKRPLLWLQIAFCLIEKNPNCYFVIAGDGPIKEQMFNLISAAQYENHFRFLGVQSDISRVLSIMDLFLLTSQVEGTPNVVLEAQWLGVPVVALEAGGTREAVYEGETGYVVQNNEVSNISSLILKVLEDPLWRAAVIHKGPEFIRKNFGMQRMIRETLALYDCQV